ncbi:RNA polymerase sigma factor [Streptomyces sp. NBC_00454]|uniref:RNA polymerase sigma factor n=1 Tax=Streptomyces sp. NBC_00454 TaxID=2975747 RepID=UPI0030E48F4B
MPEADIEKLIDELWGDRAFIGKLTWTAAITLGRDDAFVNDMVQLAAATLVDELRLGTKIEKPRAWLTMVVLNNARRVLRERASRPQDPIEGFDRGGSSPEDIVAVREILRVIRHHLPDKPRSCISLHIVGFSDREIADTLGIQKDSVVRNIERARARIKRYHVEPDLFPLYVRIAGGEK